MLAGKWTYRSFRNETELVGDQADSALALIFGEGVFDFEAEGGNRFRGALGMAGGYALRLEATADAGPAGGDPGFAIVGEGVAGTPTAGWRYDYRGHLGYQWPQGVDQPPCLLGTVIRVKAHGDAPAGVTVAFIAVKQLADRQPRPVRRFSLTAGL